MTANSHGSRNHHVQLLWVVIILIVLVTFLVDLVGWLDAGGGLLP
jgi:hypothetical protein